MTAYPMTVDEARARFKRLLAGAHSPDGQACLIEVDSQIKGEPWSDHHAKVSPVLAAYGRALNDWLVPLGEGERLWEFLPLPEPGSEALEAARLRVFVLAAAREFVPAAMDAANLPEQAAALRALSVDASYPDIEKACARAAWAASAASAASATSAAWAASATSATSAAWAARAAIYTAAIDAFRRACAVTA
jgi:hypothetical protein